MKPFTQKKGSRFQGVSSGDFFKNVPCCHQTFPEKFAAGNELFCKNPATMPDFL